MLVRSGADWAERALPQEIVASPWATNVKVVAEPDTLALVLDAPCEVIAGPMSRCPSCFASGRTAAVPWLSTTASCTSASTTANGAEGSG